MTKYGLYVPAAVLEDSRRAYVADLDDVADPPTSHGQWIERAMLAHIGRSLDDRVRVEETLPPLVEPGANVKRGFFFAPSSSDALNDAISAERLAGQPWRARSVFIVDAMRVAIEDARRRRGGSLPDAPKRLPNQPSR